METLDEVRARVERIVRDILAEREALPDIGMEARPTVRAQLAERLRLLSEYQAAIGSGQTVVLKVAARVEDCREGRATSLSASDIQERRAASASTAAERDAWMLGARWLRGEVGGSEIPGGVVAMRTELGIERLQPVPNIDAELEQQEAALAVATAALVSHLDAWDRERGVVAATVRADLAPMESSIVATVRNRATATG